MKSVRILEGSQDYQTSILTRLQLSEVANVDELLSVLDQERTSFPDVQIFITLDDVAQALYTSGHATRSGDLEGDTSDFEDLEDFDDPRVQRVLKLRQLEFTSAQLSKPALIPDWSELSGTLEAEPDWIDLLVEVNSDPTRILDEVIQVLHVPVSDELSTIAGLPNGYFSDDWDIFHNYAVTKHLSAGYGYRPLGIGASWISFHREMPLPSQLAGQLIEELKPLYGNPDLPAWKELQEVLTQQRTLFLGYTENFGE